jgi:hypothetical protein
MDNLKIKIFTFLAFVIVLATMLTFRYYIDKQKPLDMKELELIVEQEIIKYYGNIPYKKNMIQSTGYFTGNISLFGEHISCFKYNINKNKYKIIDLKQFPNSLSYIEILKIKDNIIIDEIYNKLYVIDINGYVKPLQKWIINYTCNNMYN